MNELELAGTWNEIKGKLKQKYGILTENDLIYIEGREEELMGRLQKILGKTRKEIEEELTRWEDKQEG